MEEFLDSMKKRAYRSASLSILTLSKVSVVAVLKVIIRSLKSFCAFFFVGWSLGFGGYFGLNAAFDFERHVGGHQAVFIKVAPVQPVIINTDGQPKG
ncbi:hypothetical protein A6D98_09775 [Aliivibrio fischeri]|uniref:hypothetical protein n=1 Tax=Aliivibrio fischeri TaxID=668 RepID=UPI00080EC25C|nr:hypothetical protein [Aliivibrio fischeri]OCH08074.1 hypothetical protein A6E09_17140 [Aliivibrio fischeri]OCH60879.1 hypothetical protein A6D98_09775 [Aliivibrio fischeri]